MTTSEPLMSLPEPERSGPLRVASAFARFDDGQGKAGRPVITPKDVIEHSIRVAQEVIDQQIGSGERILRHLRKAPTRKRRVGALEARSAASVTERTMALTRELGVLALEMMETLAETPTVVEVIGKWLGIVAPAMGGPTSGGGGNGATVQAYGVLVASRRPANGEVQAFVALPEDAQALDLQVAGDRHVMSRDCVKYAPDQRAFTVSVNDAQAPGRYAGVIVSASTGHPIGTLTVLVTA